ncbi:MAG: copper amine oxidase N-terminal domain-containing protein [Firmicutes bacterium]|nr:copper amine oxidase N-terminal domain-containing protein [Bacillota bacterium]
MKKLLVLFAFALLTATVFPASARAYTEIALKIGDQYAEINGGWHRLDAAPYLRNGRTMVPLRFIAGAFGADVAGYGTESGIQARIVFRNVTVFLTEGDRAAHFINEAGSDLVVAMDAAPEIKNGRMFVPIRFIASNFGCDVDWDPVDQLVIIVLNN